MLSPVLHMHWWWGQTVSGVLQRVQIFISADGIKIKFLCIIKQREQLDKKLLWKSHRLWCHHLGVNLIRYKVILFWNERFGWIQQMCIYRNIPVSLATPVLWMKLLQERFSPESFPTYSYSSACSYGSNGNNVKEFEVRNEGRHIWCNWYKRGIAE